MQIWSKTLKTPANRIFAGEKTCKGVFFRIPNLERFLVYKPKRSVWYRNESVRLFEYYTSLALPQKNTIPFREMVFFIHFS